MMGEPSGASAVRLVRRKMAAFARGPQGSEIRTNETDISRVEVDSRKRLKCARRLLECGGWWTEWVGKEGAKPEGTKRRGPSAGRDRSPDRFLQFSRLLLA